jgi:hypothetical protein
MKAMNMNSVVRVIFAGVSALAFFLTSVAARAQDPAGSASSSGTSQTPAERKPEPFGFADFTWLTGNPRTKESPLDTKAFTGEFRADTNFTYSFNRPQDDTIGGSITGTD